MGYASACLTFCKRQGGRCAAALDEFCSRAEEPVPSPCVGLASCRGQGVHASAKVTLQRGAYPFPDWSGLFRIEEYGAQFTGDALTKAAHLFRPR